MKTKMGLWIDHRKAVIVSVSEDGERIEETIKEIPSRVERQMTRMEGTSRTSYKSRPYTAQDKHERDFRGHLNVYYDEVVNSIKEADSIFIMGPGMAKSELKKRIEKQRLSERIACIEPADKMPERKIAAKVREYFIHSKPSRAEFG